MNDGWFIIWMACVFAVGYFAKEKGRNPWAWGIAAFFLSPLIVGVALGLTKDDKIEEKVEKVAMEQQQLQDRVSSNEVATNANFKAIESKVGGLGVGVEKLQSVTHNMLEEGGQTCPHCGQTIKKGASKCRFCGGIIENVPMVECPFCKELIRADASVCKYCRSAVTPSYVAPVVPKASKMVECPYCKELVEEGTHFCGYCGSDLTTVAATAAAAEGSNHVQ